MIKYLSLFSGIGAFESALTNLGVNYEIVNYCEIDKYASKSYSAIHGVPETKNLWDITKVNVFNLPKPGEIDLVTYGFPCQDISIAGKQKGLFNADGSLTRSGLFFDALKVIEYCKPKVAIAENVKNLTSKKFATQFETVLKSLEDAGYNNYWKVLNAKDYGIPQNRERVFIVSIRKDVDNELFEFPKPYKLEKRLKDFLEPYVDEKYYLSDAQITRMKTTSYVSGKINRRAFNENDIIGTLCARDYKDPKCVVKNKKQELCDYLIQNNKVTVNQPPLRIRKLTPKECYRLRGFSDEELERAENVPISNSQLYKQAGNSIVVDVLEEIFRVMLDKMIGDLK